jgi:hypothetical protein
MTRTRQPFAMIDANLDTSPKLVRASREDPSHARYAREVYLFVARRNWALGGRGGVPGNEIDTWHIARMLFMPEAEAMLGLMMAVDVGLLTILRNGEPLQISALQTVTERCNALRTVTDQDFVQIWGVGIEDIVSPRLSKDRQRDYRERKKEEKERADESTQGERYDPLRNVTRVTPEENRTDRDLEHVSLVATQVAPRETSKANKIPDRAWRAADALRAMVIACNPSSNIAPKPWDGKKRPAHVVESFDPTKKRPLAMVVVPDLGRCGNRLKWADDLRKLVEYDERTYEEIWEVMQWLQYKQPAKLGPGFIVESPKALREKWGAICAVMRGGERSQRRASDEVDSAVADMQAALEGSS